MTVAFVSLSSRHGHTFYNHPTILTHSHIIENNETDPAVELDAAWNGLLLKATQSLKQQHSYEEETGGIFSKPKKEIHTYDIKWALEPISHSVHSNLRGQLVILVSAFYFADND